MLRRPRLSAKLRVKSIQIVFILCYIIVAILVGFGKHRLVAMPC